MGGCCARDKPLSLEKSEKLQLLDLFQKRLCRKDQQDKDHYIYDPQQLNRIFSDYPLIGDMLNSYLTLFCKPNEVDFEMFIQFSEALIQDSQDISVSQFADLNKVEIIALLYISLTDTSGKDLKFKSDLKSNIDRRDAFEFLKIIQYMNYSEVPRNLQHSELMIEVMFLELNPKGDYIRWNVFVDYLNTIFRYLDESIKRYFRNRLLETDEPFKMPEFFDESYLLNQDVITILGMTDKLMTMDRRFTQIYSAKEFHFNFDDMVKVLENFGGATFMIAEFTDTEGNQVKLGTFVPTKWQIDGAQHYTDDNMIFLYYPYCQIFRSEPKKKEYYHYIFSPKRGLNSLVDSQQIAMAFGDDKTTQIWIDQDMREGSYFKININEKSCVQTKTFNLTDFEIYGMSRFKASNLEDDIDVWDEAIRKSKVPESVRYPPVDKKGPKSYQNELTSTNNFEPIKSFNQERPSNISQPPPSASTVNPRRTANDISRDYNARHSQKF